VKDINQSNAAEFQAALEEERHRVRRGEHAQAFYAPGYSANVRVSGDTVQPIPAPEGFEYDVEKWHKRGRKGEAPLKPKATIEDVNEAVEKAMDELGKEFDAKADLPLPKRKKS
jgi:hypothetical protein